MGKIEITQQGVIVDGKQIQIISGAMHYFRIHPDLWDDRLDKAVAFGLNAIETYVPWNLHELHQGEFNFEGICDLEKFIDKVHERKLLMILRPGPYICAEWDNGGIPGWLMGLPGIELRRMNDVYLKALTNYFDVLLPKIQKKIYTQGGPIIMVQVENEYGSFCHDKNYLRYIDQLYTKYGIDVPHFTSDGPAGHMLVGGTLDECLATVNFGSDSINAFNVGKTFRPNTPSFCMEFWNGWFDHWGEKHHTRGAGTEPGGAADELEKMLSAGANVNFYMFHGGTNFGFTNGANGNFPGMYEPTVTSYDYDCPLTECGDPNEKFYACQAVIAKYFDNPNIKAVETTKKVCPAPLKLTQSAPLLANLKNISSASGHKLTPPTMESLGESFGFIHYRTHIDGPMPITDNIEYEGKENLRLIEVNDYAQVWCNGKYLGSRMRDLGKNEFKLEPFGKEGIDLDILVENCGHINYGPQVGRDFKGIIGGVALELQLRLDWDYNLLPMADLSKLEFGEFNDAPATFHKGEFELDEIGEAFILCPGVKGLVWVNGFNLGRYWNIGPTETLYIPSPVLKKGKNEVIILELEKLDSDTVNFSSELRLGEPESF